MTLVYLNIEFLSDRSGIYSLSIFEAYSTLALGFLIESSLFEGVFVTSSRQVLWVELVHTFGLSGSISAYIWDLADVSPCFAHGDFLSSVIHRFSCLGSLFRALLVRIIRVIWICRSVPCSRFFFSSAGFVGVVLGF